jgi:hypothetical protein
MDRFQSLKGRTFDQFQNNRFIHFDRAIEAIDFYTKHPRRSKAYEQEQRAQHIFLKQLTNVSSCYILGGKTEFLEKKTMFALSTSQESAGSSAGSPPISRMTKRQIAFAAFYRAMGANPTTWVFREIISMAAEKIKAKATAYYLKKGLKEIGAEFRENGDIVFPKEAIEKMRRAIPREVGEELAKGFDTLNQQIGQIYRLKEET